MPADSNLFFQAPNLTGSFMGPSPDNYAAAWSLMFDGDGAEGKQPPARVPSMTGLGRAHSDPVSSGEPSFTSLCVAGRTVALTFERCSHGGSSCMRRVASTRASPCLL